MSDLELLRALFERHPGWQVIAGIFIGLGLYEAAETVDQVWRYVKRRGHTIPRTPTGEKR